jgi:hypothetical protein
MSSPHDSRLDSSTQLPEDAFSEPCTKLEVLFSNLESSLRASQQALLHHDVARLERLTAEQSLLAHSLAVYRQRSIADGNKIPSLFLPELRERATRVLHHGRVVEALLGRAQRFLRVIANLAAGTGASYAPFSPASPRHNVVPAKED